jgi:hypothetical protein
MTAAHQMYGGGIVGAGLHDLAHIVRDESEPDSNVASTAKTS